MDHMLSGISPEFRLDHDSEDDDAKTQRDQDKLCSRCRAIDFQKVYDIDVTRLQTAEEGIHIAELGSLEWSRSVTCDLCQFLVFAAQQLSTPAESLQRCRLRAYSTLTSSWSFRWPFCPEYLKSHDEPFLHICSDRESACSNVVAIGSSSCGKINFSDIASTKIKRLVSQAIPPFLNYAEISCWIQYCRSHHSRLCASASNQLSGLSVIDCYSQSIVLAPKSCSYVALSYVWSDKLRTELEAENFRINDKLPSNLPATIQDAIEVNKQLGFKYLWVDRYCIDRSSSSMLRSQIMGMDAIYAGSELTIIAAAGLDVEYGLSGVSKLRRSQRQATVGNIQLVYTGESPHNAVYSSKWSSRGWTYQEAVLSRRRLVFTEQELYFECNAMNCYESLAMDLDLLHTVDKSRSLNCWEGGIFDGTRPINFPSLDTTQHTNATALQRYVGHVPEYSDRELTREGDSFNAFAGIARRFAESAPKILTVSGVPLRYPSLAIGSQEDQTLQLLGHCWYNPSANKRSGFPSWSWVGWEGKAQYFSPLSYKSCLLHISKTYIEVANQFSVERRHFLQHNIDFAQYADVKVLHLEAPVTSPQTLRPRGTISFEYDFNGQIAWIHVSKPQLDRTHVTEMIMSQEWLLVQLGALSGGDRRLQWTVILWVVEPCQQDWRRVGLMIVHLDDEDHDLLRPSSKPRHFRFV